ncbi:MAG: hypothetical protein NTW31_08250 [Bacteroidetes bacterium]|nr:hypothetical protein [Bacteroidota bacterium]
MSLKKQFAFEVQDALKTGEKPGILSEKDIFHLPSIVQKYLNYTGCTGKEKVKNVHVVFEGEMKLDEKHEWLGIHSEQYNFHENPSRFFFITTHMKGMPVTGLHVYKSARATMVIKLAGMITVADASGPKMDQGETVTILNDMCFMAPASLISPAIAWEVIDDLTVNATLTNAGIKVSAKLFFNAEGQLINFISNDRFLSKDGKSYESLPWSTPISDYREINGRLIPTYGEAIWHYPDREYCYGRFRVKELRYNVKEMNP